MFDNPSSDWTPQELNTSLSAEEAGTVPELLEVLSSSQVHDIITTLS
jgi:hypothetical protein